MQGHVVTANRLRDGRVAYLTREGGWSTSLGDAWRLPGTEERAAALAAATAAVAEGVVVAPYAIEVTVGEDGQVLPQQYREQIRAFGPTVAGGSPAK